MKRFGKPDLKMDFLGIKKPLDVRRTAANLGAGDATCCIRCPDTPCMTFKTDINTRITNFVCPVDALSCASDGRIEVGDGCISCGICAVLCPVGAIKIEIDERANVLPPSLRLAEVLDDHNDFISRRNDLSKSINLDFPELDASVRRFSENSASLTQAAFYRLVSSLFNALGVPTFLSAAGDTNNRIDLILIDAVSSLPVEVKSATETRSINVKSIQQALENRIVLDQREFFPARSTDSSLVVGYSYPPVRSGVAELVSDIRTTYGVKIGLISIPVLYRWVMERHLHRQPFEREILVDLFGEML